MTELASGIDPDPAPREPGARPKLLEIGPAVAGTAATNVILAVLGGVGGVILARWLGPTARGHLVVIVQWPAVLGALISLGITHATTYVISRSPREASDILATATAGAAMSGAVLAVGGLFLAGEIGRTPAVVTYLRMVFLLSPVYIIGSTWTSALQAVSLTKWNVARSIHPVCYFVGLVVLAAVGALTLGTAVASLALAFLMSLAVIRLFHGTGMGLSGRPHSRILRRLYAYGSRVFLSNVPQTVNISIDQLVLSVASSVTSARLASYAVAVSLAGMALPLSVAFGSVAFPRVASATNEVERRSVERFALIGATMSAVSVMGVLAAGADWAIPRAFGPGFEPAVQALWLLAPGTVFLSLNRVLGDILRGRGRPTSVTVAEGVGAGLTVTFLAILVPRYGINGAAAVSSSAYAAVFFLLVWTLRRARASSRWEPVASPGAAPA